MSRTFFVRLNMDDMCAELDTFRTDQHAAWIAGFRAGCRGRIPDGWDGPMLAGAEFGMNCWREAEGYRAQQSDKGKRSAEARKVKTGTADPRANREPHVNHGSTTVRTGCEPDVNPSNIQHPTSTIETTNNEQPTTISCVDHVGPELLTRDGFGYRLTKQIFTQLEKTYHGVDLDGELNRMATWLLANQGKRKTAKGMLRFVNAWLNRSSVTQKTPEPVEPGPSEEDWLACCAIADSVEAEKRRKQEMA